MPELPEVEYTARQLRGTVVGATICEARVFWERSVQHPAVPDFIEAMAGQRIQSVRRRGKLLLLDLHSDLFLSIHRRMTGNFLLLPPGWRIDTSLREQDSAIWDTRGPTIHFNTTVDAVHSHEVRYCRVCFIFTDGRCLLFTDPRKFGRIELWARSQEDEVFAGLGPEPLSEMFTPERFRTALAGKKTAIKQVLLNQEVVVGIGNIYADEALFYACIHPLRPADSLTSQELHLLHEGIVSVLTLGIKHGGTSFSNYRDLWGEAGENFNHVRVYRREGKPCQRCGCIIERTVIGQRSSHYCPKCQRIS